jgi:hypothetical protein
MKSVSRQKFNRQVFVAASVCLLVGILFSASQSSKVGFNIQPALAAQEHEDAVGEIVYLPNIMVRSPLPQTTFGIESHTFNDPATLQSATDSGTFWVRKNALLWANVEYVEGQYDWSGVSAFEQELISLHEQGFQVILVVRSTPAWAQAIPGKYCGRILTSKLSAFGEFMYQAVQRYTAEPYNVKYWQIWNEPDVDPNYVADTSPYGCWAELSDPYYGGGYYADVLEAVYPRIKQADPESKVLIGGLLMGCIFPKNCTWPGSEYLAGILNHNGRGDGGSFFDIVGFHAYDDYYFNPGIGMTVGGYGNPGWDSNSSTTGPVIVAKANFIKSVLSQFGVYDKQLIATELALRCGPGEDDPSCTDYSSNSDFAKTKAYYVVESFAATIASGLQASIWYNLDGGWRNTALLFPDKSPAPAYYAFSNAVDTLLDAQFIRDIDEYPDVKGYEFTRSAYRTWVIWALDGNSHLLTLPGTPDFIQDVWGNSMQATGSQLWVGVMPIYVKWRQ